VSSARRPLLTATAAGTLLCALWFVPSANASQDSSARGATTQSVTDYAAIPVTQQARAVSAASTDSGQETEESADGTELADTGSPDPLPLRGRRVRRLFGAPRTPGLLISLDEPLTVHT
jgi:hypothetical protein